MRNRTPNFWQSRKGTFSSRKSGVRTQQPRLPPLPSERGFDANPAVQHVAACVCLMAGPPSMPRSHRGALPPIAVNRWVMADARSAGPQVTQKSAGRLGDRVVSFWSSRSGRGTNAIGGTARRGQPELPRGIARHQASRSGGETSGRTRSERRLRLQAPSLRSLP